MLLQLCFVSVGYPCFVLLSHVTSTLFCFCGLPLFCVAFTCYFGFVLFSWVTSALFCFHRLLFTLSCFRMLLLFRFVFTGYFHFFLSSRITSTLFCFWGYLDCALCCFPQVTSTLATSDRSGVLRRSWNTGWLVPTKASSLLQKCPLAAWRSQAWEGRGANMDWRNTWKSNTFAWVGSSLVSLAAVGVVFRPEPLSSQAFQPGDFAAVLCWLAECTMVWVVQRFRWLWFASFECCGYLSSSVDARPYVLWRFGTASSSSLLHCYALSCEGTNLKQKWLPAF